MRRAKSAIFRGPSRLSSFCTQDYSLTLVTAPPPRSTGYYTPPSVSTLFPLGEGQHDVRFYILSRSTRSPLRRWVRHITYQVRMAQTVSIAESYGSAVMPASPAHVYIAPPFQDMASQLVLAFATLVIPTLLLYLAIYARVINQARIANTLTIVSIVACFAFPTRYPVSCGPVKAIQNTAGN